MYIINIQQFWCVSASIDNVTAISKILFVLSFYSYFKFFFYFVFYLIFFYIYLYIMYIYYTIHFLCVPQYVLESAFNGFVVITLYILPTGATYISDVICMAMW